MKIIDANAEDREARRLEREATVNREIISLGSQLLPNLFAVDDNEEERLTAGILKIPFAEKAIYKERMELAIDFIAFAQLAKSAPPQSAPTPSTFNGFSRLPIELRLKIWGYALETYCRERVHCIDISKSNKENYNEIIEARPEQNWKFVSNQPIPGIVHACHESRNLYLSRTDAKYCPALATYINLNMDIVYVPHVEHTDTTHCEFIFGDYGCAKEIQRLAMPKSLYCELPTRNDGEHMSDQHIRLRGQMPKWREMLIVFEDDAFEDIWAATEGRFVDMTARQKRRKAERGYARQCAQTLNSMVQEDMEPMNYRFVVHQP
ncbi:hypothetical protein BDZ45DRAFT_696903 [Acephala macrosclerotiorum]|nr:hypothetical protein BDZ45DRAFT_696903 [Acephala macrosclerotiorum]